MGWAVLDNPAPPVYHEWENKKGGIAMTIDGFQPMTLLDFPNKVGCTVFLKGCNFRCPFCHNATLVELEREQSAPPLALENFRDFLQRRQGP